MPEQKPEEIKSMPSKELAEIKELTVKQQIGIVSILLNQCIQARLSNEITYRMATKAFERSHGNKGERESALNGMTKAKSWLEGDDTGIAIHRGLIEELQGGKFKI